MVFMEDFGLLAPYFVFLASFLFIAVLFVMERYNKVWHRVLGVIVAFFMSWFVPFPLILLYLLLHNINISLSYLVMALLMTIVLYLDYKSYKEYF